MCVMKEIILETKLNEIPLLKRGKVRDIYDLGEYILLVATDRISAFDVVLPNGIPDKGRVLTEISLFWFRQMEHIIKNHIVAIDINDFPKQLQKYDTVLRGRSMLVRKTMPMTPMITSATAHRLAMMVRRGEHPTLFSLIKIG